MSETNERPRSPKQFHQEVSQTIAVVMERFGEGMASHMGSLGELDRVAHFKLNPEYSSQNLQAQAGFSAEIKQVARKNAEAAIKGSSRRIARTDDVGSVNHQKYDVVATDKAGSPLLDGDGNFTRGAQQKTFYKVERYDKLYGKYFEKYESTPILVPRDQYEGIKARWESEVRGLERQRVYVAREGDETTSAQLKKQIDRIKDAKSRLKPAELTTKEALFGRSHPVLSVMVDVAGVANRAGVEAAGFGAVSGLVVNSVHQLGKIFRGEKELGEGFKDLALDTGKSAGVAYLSGATTATLGAVLRTSTEPVLQNLAKKSGPAAIVGTAVVLSKQVGLLASGKVTIDQFVSNVGQEGTQLAMSMYGSQTGAIVGTLLLPGVGTLVGGFVGGMVASMMSSALFQELQASIRDANLSESRRKDLEQLSLHVLATEANTRMDMDRLFGEFFASKEQAFRNGFDSIARDLRAGRSLHQGLVIVAEAFQLDLRFATLQEFDQHRRSGKSLTFG